MSSPRLDLVHLAIRSGVLGQIRWKDSAEGLVRDDAELEKLGLTPRKIRALLRQFVVDGNLLEARAETREEYLSENPDDPYWYRAIVPVPELQHGVFIEIKLVDNDPVEPWVEIVSAHRQEK